MRIVVAGMVARDAHQGGAIWAVLQYVLGLRALGHDVVLAEEVGADRFDEVAPRFTALTRELDVAGVLVSASRRTGALDGADLLLNISGTLTDEALLERCATRAYVDLDPGFTQLWHASGEADMGFDRHDRFVTIGHGIGDRIPDCGREWISTPQPVVLERWPASDAPTDGALTTVGHWRAYGSIHHDGAHYGQKAHSLRPLLGLPRATGSRFRLALGIHPDEREDLAALDRSGWELVDPVEAAGTPDAYRSFVRGSWAEFGLAKHGYVQARCGWFSDRSVCYLASGRPVLAQDTGFGSWLPTGVGVIPFRGSDEVAAGIESLRSDYARHRRAARELAEQVFRAERVLGELIDRLAPCR